MALRETAAFVAAWGAIGIGTGIAAEQHTNDVSRGRIVTIDTCKKVAPSGEAIGHTLLKCMEEGAPNGNKIGKQLEEGQPAEFVDGLRASQVNEANTDDWGNVLLYGAAGLAVGAFFFGGPDAFRGHVSRK